MLDLTTEFKFQLLAAQQKNKELKEKMDFLKVKISFPLLNGYSGQRLHFITGKGSA